jgi:hypothetical protein
MAGIIGCTNGILTGFNVGYTSVGLDSMQVEALEGNAPFPISDRQIGMFGE